MNDEIGYFTALRSAAKNTERQYPKKDDERSRYGTIFPKCKTSFDIDFSERTTIFTIGSCFARSIEEALVAHRVRVPVAEFSIPKDEYPYRPSGILNEYNPGSISQRIIHTLDRMPFPDSTLANTKDGLIFDLLLFYGKPVSRERAEQRRAEIDRVYEAMTRSDVVIITLGLVEAWFDRTTGLYLNRMPPPFEATRDRERFVLRRLGVDDTIGLLRPAIGKLAERGIKVILTVSPVPLQTTFLDDDCTMANEYSKSVLRVAAEELRRLPGVDYFPSYEIVRAAGLSGYNDDQVHVKTDLVGEITSYMIDCYQSG